MNFGLIWRSWLCDLCNTQKRELKDIQGKLDRLRREQKRTKTLPEKDKVGGAITRLDLNRLRIQREHVQHLAAHKYKKSSPP